MAQKASLPSEGYEHPDLIRFEDGLPVVRFFPEHGHQYYDFRFTLGLPAPITKELAEGFAQATGPAGTRRTYSSAKSVFSALRIFAKTVRNGSPVPTSLRELTASYLHKAKLSSSSNSHYVTMVHTLRLVLRGSKNLDSSFRDALYLPLRAREPVSPVSAYSNAEMALIRRAARKIVRAALVRIRASRETAATYLASNGIPAHDQIAAGENQRACLLAHIVSHGGLPRQQNGAPTVCGSGSLIAELHPSQEETWALAVLLICLTGLNLSTVVNLTTEHVRGSAVGEVPVLHLRGIKARRGPWNSEMDLTFVGNARRSSTDDLGTPYGIYQLALELGQDMRRHTGDDALFMVFTSKRRMDTWSGFGYKRLTSNWGTQLKGFTDVKAGPGLVDTRRIRRWFLDRHQRPVAQSVSALASIYLAKDSSTVSAYQGVVEEALDEEFQRIRVENLRRVLTAADRLEAARDPSAVAKRFDIDVAILPKLLSGELDTVTSACIDNDGSPYSPPGQPCTASFLLCLGCPCSRSEPRHLPIQAFTLVELRNLRSSKDEAEWQRKFSTATARLEDLMALQRADVETEAARATEEEVRMVRSLVAGDLDL